jgi:transketolase
MRTAFVSALCEIAAGDPRVMLLTADLGWSVLERFAAAYPDRFLNVGVAEQNMLGLATGLALAGRVPFVYSIATFAAMRGYEQFRDGAVLHRLPVRVVGIGGGFSYGHAGPTHHALEDLTIMRTQPGVTVIAPADNAQAGSAVRATVHLPGPVYLRLDKTDYPDIAGLGGRFELDAPELVLPGDDLLYLVTGSIAQEVLKAADLAHARGTSAAVAVLAHLGFTAGPALVELLSGFRTVVTVEEGSVAGGLGSLAAEAVARNGLNCRVQMCGVKVPFLKVTGGVDYMRRQHGLDAVTLAALALPAEADFPRVAA